MKSRGKEKLVSERGRRILKESLRKNYTIAFGSVLK